MNSLRDVRLFIGGPFLIEPNARSVQGSDVRFQLKEKTPGGYSPKIPIRVCAAQRGRDFGTPYLERGIHFRDVS